MDSETALKLAEAMNRLAAAIEGIKSSGLGGIQVWHHGLQPALTPQYAPNYPAMPSYPQFYPVTCGPATMGGTN